MLTLVFPAEEFVKKSHLKAPKSARPQGNNSGRATSQSSLRIGIHSLLFCSGPKADALAVTQPRFPTCKLLGVLSWGVRVSTRGDA